MKLDWKSCFRIAVTAFALYLCVHHWTDALHFVTLLSGALQPVIIGFILAYVLNILLCFYEKHLFAPHPKGKPDGRFVAMLRKRRHGLCILMAFLTAVLLIVLILLLVIPQLIACVELLIEKIPPALDALIRSVMENERIQESGILDTLNLNLQEFNWQERIQQLIGVVTSSLGSAVGFLTGAITSTVSGVVTGFLSIIFALYMLLGKGRLIRQFNRLVDRYVKPAYSKKGRYVLHVLNDSFHRYIVGQCTEALILGALCTVGMLVLQLPYATMIGALVAFTALIPVAGAYIGAGVGAFMIMTVSPLQALIFLIFLVVLQQLEGNLIYPRVVGSSLGLPGMWVLFAVTLGGSLLGIGGMLLFVPLTAAVYRLLREDVNRADTPLMKPET